MKLSIQNVFKSYNVQALKDVNLELSPGIIGLLGPNGAGKTTLMKVISTVTKPSSGKVFWNKTNIIDSPKKIREVLGYLPQDFGVYPQLNAIEFLEYIAAVKGLKGNKIHKRIDQLLELVNLKNVKKRPLKSYSGGMKQRLGIAQALINNPDLLILDEPTVGLDPEERVRFRYLLTDLAKNKIVILSTHIVSDVEAIASDIALLFNGRLILHSSPENMLKKVENKVWESVVESKRLPEIKDKYIITKTVRSKNGIKVRIVNETKPELDSYAVNPLLEDAYLYQISKNNKEVS